jgi:hypothetical protein
VTPAKHPQYLDYLWARNAGHQADNPRFRAFGHGLGEYRRYLFGVRFRLAEANLEQVAGHPGQVVLVRFCSQR